MPEQSKTLTVKQRLVFYVNPCPPKSIYQLFFHLLCSSINNHVKMKNTTIRTKNAEKSDLVSGMTERTQQT